MAGGVNDDDLSVPSIAGNATPYIPRGPRLTPVWGREASLPPQVASLKGIYDSFGIVGVFIKAKIVVLSCGHSEMARSSNPALSTNCS